MRRFFLTYICLLLSLPSFAGIIQGRVFLKDSTVVPGDYVMVYNKEEGIGTQSDEDGNFIIELNKTGKTTLEFSRIGYEIRFIEVDTRYDTTLDDVILEPQLLMLSSAFVTPEGMSPVDYILSSLWAKSKENKKKQSDYQCDIRYDVATHEIPVVAGVLPKIATGTMKFAAAVKGYGPLVRYCLEEDELVASVQMSRVVRRGKATDYNKKLIKGQDLPKKVQANLLSLFELIDLYKILYETATAWGEDFSRKHKFVHTGTYAYGDKLVDVVEYTSRANVKTVAHIVEDDWGVLKLQIYMRGEGESIRCEARDCGNGVYMPVSFVLKPSFTMVRAEDIPALIEEVKKLKEFNNATKERAIKVLESHLGEDFNPYISLGFNIRYVKP